MYNELYEAWKREKETCEVQPLSKDFYTKLNEYIRKAKEESRMLDEKTLRAKILIREAKNVRRMVNELVSLRQQKIARIMLAGEALSSDKLPQEEEKLAEGIALPLESFQELGKELLSGHLQQAPSTQRPKQKVLRFLKETPSIIGADMKAYGPFKPEDVASIPQENARILVKQGIAVEVEVKL